jgi:hypothetical protein
VPRDAAEILRLLSDSRASPELDRSDGSRRSPSREKGGEMDDVDICPPWWPRMLWWLINHPHEPVGGVVSDKSKKATESLLVALNEFHTAYAIGPRQEDLRIQVQQVAVKQIQEAVEQLVAVTESEAVASAGLTER